MSLSGKLVFIAVSSCLVGLDFGGALFCVFICLFLCACDGLVCLFCGFGWVFVWFVCLCVFHLIIPNCDALFCIYLPSIATVSFRPFLQFLMVTGFSSSTYNFLYYYIPSFCLIYSVGFSC